MRIPVKLANRGYILPVPCWRLLHGRRGKILTGSEDASRILQNQLSSCKWMAREDRPAIDALTDQDSASNFPHLTLKRNEKTLSLTSLRRSYLDGLSAIVTLQIVIGNSRQTKEDHNGSDNR